MPTTTPDALMVAATSPTGAEIPDLDRETPPGLRWTTDLESRPIILGHDYPEIRPVLDIRADRFWTNSRHGLAIGRARIDLDEGACWYAFAPDMATAHERVAFLVDAAGAWDQAINHYAKELSS